MSMADDYGEFWRERKAANQAERMKQLARAQEDPRSAQWSKHTTYHWSRMVNGHKLDFWPSTNKFMYKNKVHFGGLNKIDKFLKEILNG